MNSMTFRGHKASVVIEVEMRHGTLRIPVDDLADFHERSKSLGELRIVIGQPLMQRLYIGLREAQKDFGPDA